MDMQTMYFGSPGQLVKLVVPGGMMPQSSDRQSAVYRLASGAARGDRMLHGRRTFTLPYNGLTLDNFNVLAAYQEGHYGPGPFAFLNPSQRNLLTRNQSASGGQTGDASGFTLTPAGTADLAVSLSSPMSTNGFAQPQTSIRALFTGATPANPKLSFDYPSSDWLGGIPCAVRPHSFGFWGIASGGNSSVGGVQPTIVYKDWLGATLSTVSATAATATGSWAYFKVENAVAPFGTAYMDISILMDGSTIAANEGILVYQPIVNEGMTVDVKWSIGTGVYPVMIMGLDDIPPAWDMRARNAPNFVLQEVG